MGISRRNFLARGASVVAGAGLVGAAVAEEKVAAGAKAEEPTKPEEQKRKMIGACGLACTTCPLMKAGKCKGCGSGKEAAADEMLQKKPCPVLQCAMMKKIDYCGTGCKGFTKCPKLVGKPYDKNFLAMIAKKLAPAKTA